MVRPMPTMNVIPPTPLVSHTSDPAPPTIADHNVHTGNPDDQDKPRPPSESLLPCTPTGYDEMEVILKRVAEETSLTAQQVAETWHQDQDHVTVNSNYWNKYQAFWKANKAAEPMIPATPTMMSRCYKHFVSDQGEDWKETLDVFKISEVMKTSEQTLAQQGRVFGNIQHKICNMMDMAAEKYGFQSVLVMCGNIVNEDNSFGHAYATKGATEFWPTHCKADEDTIIGHLKAHVFHMASLDTVAKAFGEGDNTSDDHDDDQMKVRIDPCAKSSSCDIGTSATVEASYEAQKNALKKHLLELISAGADVSRLGGKNFPWKVLLPLLANSGFIIEGYPFDTLMPGECRSKRTKGISDLKLSEMKCLICAIQAGTLKVKHIKGAREIRK
ncbi:hypothetical protein JVU11DRAFT_10982 [Chiua virens]|nr:hypothetical protein JVU11DRAFT_10982 [Chiua virens]